MTSTALLLEEHNRYAKKIGANPLKSWKGSRVDLAERVDGMKRQADELDGTKTGRIKSNKPNSANTPKSKADSLIETEAKRKKEVDDLITVADVAAELKINPKVARAKLRRAGKNSNEGRWPTFKRNSAEHKDLIEFLKGSGHAED